MPKTAISNINCFNILGFNNRLGKVYNKSDLTFEDVTNRYIKIKQGFEKRYRSNEINSETIKAFSKKKQQLDYQKKWIEYAYYQIRNNKSAINLRNAIVWISKFTNDVRLDYPFETEVKASERIIDLHVYNDEKEIVKRIPYYNESEKRHPIPVIKRIARVDEDIARVKDGVETVNKYNRLAKYKIVIPSSKNGKDEIIYVYAGNVNDSLLQADMNFQKVFLQATEKEYLKRNRMEAPYIGNFASEKIGKYYIKKDKLQEKAAQRAEEVLLKKKVEKKEERLGKGR